jgi:CRISPR-associated protein Cas6
VSETIDLVFPLSGSLLRPDYALPLWQSLRVTLPWLIDEPSAGILPISGASAGDGILYLSHRAHLTLRLPQERVADAYALSGLQLDLGGGISIGEAHLRALHPSPAQYSACVAFGCAVEEEFLAECGTRLDEMGISCSLVCGRAQARSGEDGEIRGFSLMLHGLAPEDSLRIQQLGLGEARKLGCGIFVPHKTATAVGAA